MSSGEPPTGRGRPTVIDRERIASAAMRLWRERGYAATRWSDLAEATGVSERTLVRHFDTQAAVLDVGIDRAVVRLREVMAEHPDTEVAAALVEGIGVIVSTGEGVGEPGADAGDWATVLSREPALQAWMRTGNQPWITAISEAIQARRPDVDAAACDAIAAAFEAAASAAMLRWASDGSHDDPADHVRAALRWIRIAEPGAPPA